MQEFIERELSVPGASVFIGTSQWVQPETWTCPDARYVVCQRLSERHAALQLQTGTREIREVYPRVHALGFMPMRGRITMRPLGEPLRTLNCWFDRDTFEAETGIDESGWSDRAGEFLTVANSHVETLMRRIRLELEQPAFGSRQVIEAASTMILVEMARIGRAQRAEGGSVTGLAPWQIRRVRERLAHAVEAGYPDIQELAALCGVSRSHFMRMFKASTGQTAHAFIANSRLAAAQDLLRQEQRSIKEIAALLGFSSPGHFTHAFRREKHMTPSEFRRLARANLTGAA
mgnify:CR=1 FL=1